MFVYISGIFSYSFPVNTLDIFIECNENISIFTSAKHEWKFDVFIKRDESFYGIDWKKVDFLFVLLFKFSAQHVKH